MLDMRMASIEDFQNLERTLLELLSNKYLDEASKVDVNRRLVECRNKMATFQK